MNQKKSFSHGFLTFVLAVPIFFSFCRITAAFDSPILLVFHSPTCHVCAAVKEKAIPEIEKRFKDRIKIDYRDITDLESYKLLLSLKQKYGGQDNQSLPVFFLEGHFFTGNPQDVPGLQNFIESALRNSKASGNLPEIDLIERFRSFKPLVIAAAGLIDGINPCAFTVIVFFISFLALQGYRKKELFVIGLSFIFAVFLIYILLGLGIFGFFYRLRAFWVVSKCVNVSIGIFSVILGFLSVYDLVKYAKTKQSEGLLLQLPKSVKNQIHKVIGLHYRKDKGSDRKDTRKVRQLILSAFITGALVSLLEAVCTGQTYLPAITFILKTSNLKLQAFAYLLFYNLLFIAPLVAILLLSLIGVTSGQFSGFFKRHLGFVKFLMAVLFFGLGIFLIRRG